MTEEFCFSCGEPTVALGQQLVPVCANCRARGVGESLTKPEWLLRIGGQLRTLGPMSRVAVLSGIARGRFTHDDQVSAIGGDALAIADHPDFRGCFIPGSADEVEIQRLRKEARQAARRASQRRTMRGVFGAVFLFTAVGLLWLSSNSRLLILPDTLMVQLEETLQWWQNQTKRGRHYAGVFKVGDLPHGAWVEAQRPDTDGLAYHRARAEHWDGSRRELEGVRRGYLQSISRSPLDPMPLAGLVQVDSVMLYTRPELLGEINRAVSRLDVLNAKGPAVSAARAELALAQGNRDKAKRETQSCAETDAICGLLFGEATLDTRVIGAIIDKYGPKPRALRSLCRAGLAAEDWIAVERCTNALKRHNSDDPSGYEFAAEMHASLGHWSRAQKAARGAMRRGSERGEIAHLFASVTFTRDPRNRGLTSAYSTLIEHPHLAGHTHREVVLLQAVQLQIQLGDLEQARVIVDAAIEAHPTSHAARILLADILYKEGRHGESESILRDIEAGGLSPEDAAMIHMWAARLYFEMGKQRLGRAEIENSIRLNPLAPFNYTELAWASVTTGNTQGAVESLDRLVRLAAYRTLNRDPRLGLGLRMPKPRSLDRPMLEAMAGDVRYENEREPTAAILSWWSGEPGHLDRLLEVIEDQPNHLALQTAVAFAAFEAGEWELACNNALAVVSRRPSLAIMHSIRGRSLGKLGRWAEAVDPLNRSVKGEAEQADLLLWAAQAWVEKGDYSEAQDLITRAKKLAPWDPRIRQAQFALTSNGQ